MPEHPNPLPRLITGVAHTQGSGGDSPPSVTLTLDNSVNRVEAALDRQSTALQAANLQ